MAIITSFYSLLSVGNWAQPLAQVANQKLIGYRRLPTLFILLPGERLLVIGSLYTSLAVNLSLLGGPIGLYQLPKEGHRYFRY